MHPDSAYAGGRWLLSEQIRFFRNSGYLIAPDLLSASEIGDLKEETTRIFRGERGKLEGLVPTKGLSDSEVLRNYVAIHFPHKISPLIHAYLGHPFIVDVLTQLVSPNVKCMQSMLFVKGPKKAGQSWHQDEFYIPTRDKSLIGVWIALDDATIDNGCLWIIPGAPRHIMPRVPNDSTEYADVDTVDVRALQPQLPVEVRSGSVVFFNGYTLHSSLRNKTTDCFRMALVNHYMSAESMLPWDQDGHLPPTEDLRDIVMVAGEDPYAFKGTVSVNKPYLRPEVLKIKTSL